MALRFVKSRSGGLNPLAAGLGLSLAVFALFSTPAEARHYRHYRAYARHYAPVRHYAHYGRYAAPARHASPAANPAFAAMVVDENSGRTLYAASENEPRHPASLTKVMTLYLLFEQLEKGRLTLESPIVMSAHAASQAPSKLGLAPGEALSVEEAIKAVVTRSANDVAVAIGENIAGDEGSFAEMMTRKAHSIGMARTTYVNASGLPDDRQITTAHDLTLLGQAVEQRFPRYFHYFSTHSFDFAGETIGNHNHLLGRVDGVDGIKTGYTRASGFNLLTSMHRDGRSLVAVVMGGPTAGARDRFMESLLAQHLASAATSRSATMIADASTPEPVRVASMAMDRRPPAAPLQLAADLPAPPIREAAIVPANFETPTPPAREVAALSEEDAEGDGDTLDRAPPAPKLEAARHVAIKRVTPALAAAAPAVPAPPARVAEQSPAAQGWVKGPEGIVAAAEAKPAPVAKLLVASIATPAPLSAPARAATPNPAALGWVKGPEGIAAAPAAPVRVADASLAVPAKAGAAAAARAKDESRVARNDDPRPTSRDGWMIQIGATDNAGKASDLLSRAWTQNRSTLASAKPLTEKVEKGDGTFYRARFAGLDSNTAEAACKSLKRTGFSCFATRD
jgi:D-alanyl-D-alanine carboxypeptidase